MGGKGKKKEERNGGKEGKGSRQINVFRREREREWVHTYVYMTGKSIKMISPPPLKYVGYKLIMAYKEVTECNQSTQSGLLCQTIDPPHSQGNTLVVKWMHFPHLE